MRACARAFHTLSKSLPGVLAKGCRVSAGRVELWPTSCWRLPASRAEGGPRGKARVGAWPSAKASSIFGFLLQLYLKLAHDN